MARRVREDRRGGGGASQRRSPGARCSMDTYALARPSCTCAATAPPPNRIAAGAARRTTTTGALNDRGSIPLQDDGRGGACRSGDRRDPPDAFDVRAARRRRGSRPCSVRVAIWNPCRRRSQARAVKLRSIALAGGKYRRAGRTQPDANGGRSRLRRSGPGPIRHRCRRGPRRHLVLLRSTRPR